MRRWTRCRAGLDATQFVALIAVVMVGQVVYTVVQREREETGAGAEVAFE